MNRLRKTPLFYLAAFVIAVAFAAMPLHFMLHAAEHDADHGPGHSTDTCHVCALAKLLVLVTGLILMMLVSRRSQSFVLSYSQNFVSRFGSPNTALRAPPLNF